MRLPDAQVDGIGHGGGKIKHLANSGSINLLQSIGDPAFTHKNRLSFTGNSVELSVATVLSITELPNGRILTITPNCPPKYRRIEIALS